MTVFRVELTVEDYIIEEWCDTEEIDESDFDNHAMDFIDYWIGVYPDDVVVL